MQTNALGTMSEKEPLTIFNGKIYRYKPKITLDELIRNIKEDKITKNYLASKGPLLVDENFAWGFKEVLDEKKIFKLIEDHYSNKWEEEFKSKHKNLSLTERYINFLTDNPKKIGQLAECNINFKVDKDYLMWAVIETGEYILKDDRIDKTLFELNKNPKEEDAQQLINYLEKDLKIEMSNDATVETSKNKISITNKKNSILFTLDKNKAYLTIKGGNTFEYQIIKSEDKDKLEIANYKLYKFPSAKIGIQIKFDSYHKDPFIEYTEDGSNIKLMEKRYCHPYVKADPDSGDRKLPGENFCFGGIYKQHKEEFSKLPLLDEIKSILVTASNMMTTGYYGPGAALAPVSRLNDSQYDKMRILESDVGSTPITNTSVVPAEEEKK